METIKFRRTALTNFVVIDKPGKYLLPTYSNVTDRNLVANEDGSAPRYIATFKAIAVDKVAQVKETFAAAEEVEIELTNGLFMTGNIWVKDGERPTLPMKGEMAECVVDYVTSREGEQVLRITNVRPAEAKTAEKINILSFFAPTEAPTTTEGSLQHS